jgi:hypothetical protein
VARFVLRLGENLSENGGEVSGQYQWLLRKRVFILTISVPVGGGVGRIFNIGEQAIKTKLEAYYNVDKPEYAPDYSIAFQFSFLFSEIGACWT